jgi:hypothetical protein
MASKSFSKIGIDVCDIKNSEKHKEYINSIDYYKILFEYNMRKNILDNVDEYFDRKPIVTYRTKLDEYTLNIVDILDKHDPNLTMSILNKIIIELNSVGYDIMYYVDHHTIYIGG